jgi:hypothetical protein
MQLACQWNLRTRPSSCVVPTLIQEIGDGARPIEDKRSELAAASGEPRSVADRGRRDPRDRRQHRLHGAQGGDAGPTPARNARSWPVSSELAGSPTLGIDQDEICGRPKRRPANLEAVPSSQEPMTAVIAAIRRVLLGHGLDRVHALASPAESASACRSSGSISWFAVLWEDVVPSTARVAVFIGTGFGLRSYMALLDASPGSGRGLLRREAPEGAAARDPGTAACATRPINPAPSQRSRREAVRRYAIVSLVAF